MQMLRSLTFPERWRRHVIRKVPLPATPRARDDAHLVSIKHSLTILTVLALLFTAWVAAPILLPLTVAVLIAAVLAPIVKALMRVGVPRAMAATLTLGACVAFLAVGVTALVHPAAEWVDRAPSILKRIESQLNPLKKPMEKVQSATRRVEELANIDRSKEETVVVRESSLLNDFLTTIPNALGYTLAVVVLVFFLLLFAEPLIDNVIGSIRERRMQRRVAVFFARVEREISRYLLATTIINVGLGALAALVLALLGFPNPLLWGAVVGLLNFAPYIGPAIGLTIILIVSIVTFDSPWAILTPVLSVAMLNVVEGEFVTPLVLGKRLSLNPLVIFVWVMLWTWMWGAAGALVATPLLACVRIMAQHRFYRPLPRTPAPSSSVT